MSSKKGPPDLVAILIRKAEVFSATEFVNTGMERIDSGLLAPHPSGGCAVQNFLLKFCRTPRVLIRGFHCRHSVKQAQPHLFH